MNDKVVKVGDTKTLVAHAILRQENEGLVGQAVTGWVRQPDGTTIELGIAMAEERREFVENFVLVRFPPFTFQQPGEHFLRAKIGDKEVLPPVQIVAMPVE